MVLNEPGTSRRGRRPDPANRHQHRALVDGTAPGEQAHEQQEVGLNGAKGQHRIRAGLIPFRVDLHAISVDAGDRRGSGGAALPARTGSAMALRAARGPRNSSLESGSAASPRASRNYSLAAWRHARPGAASPVRGRQARRCVGSAACEPAWRRGVSTGRCQSSGCNLSNRSTSERALVLKTSAAPVAELAGMLPRSPRTRRPEQCGLHTSTESAGGSGLPARARRISSAYSSAPQTRCAATSATLQSPQAPGVSHSSGVRGNRLACSHSLAARATAISGVIVMGIPSGSRLVNCSPITGQGELGESHCDRPTRSDFPRPLQAREALLLLALGRLQAAPIHQNRGRAGPSSRTANVW